MIVWSGLGFLVPVILIINGIIVDLLCGLITGNSQFYDQNKWPLTVVLIITGILCWFLGKYLNKPNDKIYIDKETGKEVQLRKSHRFFFIKMQYWGPILGVIGIIALFTK